MIMTTEAEKNYPHNHVEIDLPTGLPKLSIELLPDAEEDNRLRRLDLPSPLAQAYSRGHIHVDMASRVSRVTSIKMAYVCESRSVAIGYIVPTVYMMYIHMVVSGSARGICHPSIIASSSCRKKYLPFPIRVCTVLVR